MKNLIMYPIRKTLRFISFSIFFISIVLIVNRCSNVAEDILFNNNIQNRISQLSVSERINKSSDEEFVVIRSSFLDSLSLYESLSKNIEFSSENKIVFDNMLSGVYKTISDKANEIISRKQKEEEELKIKKEKEKAWMQKYWHVGKWEMKVDNLKIILDLKQNGSCNVFFVDGWINNLTYKKTSSKILISPIGNVNLKFNVNNSKRRVYTSDGTRMRKIK